MFCVFVFFLNKCSENSGSTTVASIFPYATVRSYVRRYKKVKVSGVRKQLLAQNVLDPWLIFMLISLASCMFWKRGHKKSHSGALILLIVGFLQQEKFLLRKYYLIFSFKSSERVRSNVFFEIWRLHTIEAADWARLSRKRSWMTLMIADYSWLMAVKHTLKLFIDK
jgi:hypothetical protein